MSIQALFAILVGIAGIISGGIALYNFLVKRGYKARINECHMQYRDIVGRPLTDIQKAVPSKPFGTRGRVQRFKSIDKYATRLWNEKEHNHVVGVSIYSSKKRGTFPVWGSIGQWYEKRDGTAGRLGFPTSAEQIINDNPETSVQHFEGGKITCVAGHDPKIEYTI